MIDEDSYYEKICPELRLSSKQRKSLTAPELAIDRKEWDGFATSFIDVLIKDYLDGYFKDPADMFEVLVKVSIGCHPLFRLRILGLLAAKYSAFDKPRVKPGKPAVLPWQRRAFADLDQIAHTKNPFLDRSHKTKKESSTISIAYKMLELLDLHRDINGKKISLKTADKWAAKSRSISHTSNTPS